jgi:hypothetical protein
MKLAISILGQEVFSVEIVRHGGAEGQEDHFGIGGGEAHNFERDPSPIDALGEIPWSEYEDRGRFGFS